MKKLVILSAVILTMVSCSSTKDKGGTKELYKVLVSSEYGGGSFQFYEIITEEKEFKMLMGDDELRKFLKPDDYKTANFVLLNMGEKSSGGYSIEVMKVEELPDKIVVTVRENSPSGMAATVMTNPYTVLRINSKKPIEIK